MKKRIAPASEEQISFRDALEASQTVSEACNVVADEIKLDSIATD